jgi:RNA polymerase sigma-70 factor (ECF subfamily)
VHAIAKYKLVDFLRRRQMSIPIEGSLSDEIDFFSSPNMAAAEARRDLLKLLDQLPEGQRRPIVHTKLEGLSVQEAARLTGMSPSAVKVGVHRGLKALAAKMRDT